MSEKVQMGSKQHVNKQKSFHYHTLKFHACFKFESIELSEIYFKFYTYSKGHKKFHEIDYIFCIYVHHVHVWSY
jgi:hypothetical protein